MKHTVLSIIILGILASAAWAAGQSTLSPAELEQLTKAVAAYESGADAQPLRRMEGLVRDSGSIPGLRFQLENALAKVLAPASTFEGKRFACQQLGLIGTETSLPAIAELLKDEQTAGMACLALGTHPSPKANTILEEALGAARGLGRAQIINALGNRRDAEAVALLTALAHDADTVAVEASITALGKIATPAACATLAELRKEKNPALAGVAALASLNAAGVLSATGKERANRQAALEIYQDLVGSAKPSYIRRAALAGLLRLDPAGSEKRIFEVLHGEDAALKPVAIAGIRSLKARNASAKFAAELPKLKPSEQVLVIEALASRGDSGARSALLSSLKAQDAEVRAASIAALAKTGDASVVPALAKGLAQTSDSQERQLLMQTLVRMSGGKKIDQAITAELKAAAPEQKAAFISILAQRGAQSAVPVLLKETSNRVVAKEAFRALALVASGADAREVLDALVNLKVPEARAEAQEATAHCISQMPAEKGSALVRKVLARPSNNLDTHCSLLRLLSVCPDNEALFEIYAALAAQESRIREAAFLTFIEWQDLAAWDKLAAMYAHPESETQRVLALRALVRLAGEANTQMDAKLPARYKELLAGAKTDEDRKLILSALAGAADPQTLDMAASLLGAPGVRAEAEMAVKKIAESVKAKYPQEAQKALERLK